MRASLDPIIMRAMARERPERYPTAAPTAAYALYITDGTAVFGVTVSATSAIRLWRTPQVSVPRWVQQ